MNQMHGAHDSSNDDMRYVHELREFNLYPDGYDVAELGTFPTRAPAPATPSSPG